MLQLISHFPFGLEYWEQVRSESSYAKTEDSQSASGLFPVWCAWRLICVVSLNDGGAFCILILYCIPCLVEDKLHRIKSAFNSTLIIVFEIKINFQNPRSSISTWPTTTTLLSSCGNDRETKTIICQVCSIYMEYHYNYLWNSVMIKMNQIRSLTCWTHLDTMLWQHHMLHKTDCDSCSMLK